MTQLNIELLTNIHYHDLDIFLIYNNLPFLQYRRPDMKDN